jgi:hypothetical protein
MRPSFKDPFCRAVPNPKVLISRFATFSPPYVGGSAGGAWALGAAAVDADAAHVGGHARWAGGGAPATTSTARRRSLRRRVRLQPHLRLRTTHVGTGAPSPPI